MNMVRHDGAAPNSQPRLVHVLGEPAPDCSCLQTIETNWWVLQVFLRGQAFRPVVWVGGLRSAFRDFVFRCCTTCPEQIPRSNKSGPRASWIVWQPEAIGREYEMVANNHGWCSHGIDVRSSVTRGKAGFCLCVTRSKAGFCLCVTRSKAGFCLCVTRSKAGFCLCVTRGKTLLYFCRESQTSATYSTPFKSARFPS
jgi:hypothetical protein